MAVVFVEMDVACLAGREWATVLVALDWRISVVYCHVVRDRVIPTIDLSADAATIASRDGFYVFLVSTPP